MEKIIFTEEELKLIETSLLAFGIEEQETEIYSKIDRLINKPVTTTNEQPKNKKCSCIKPHYGFTQIAVCTDCDGVKDDEYWKKLG